MSIWHSLQAPSSLRCLTQGLGGRLFSRTNSVNALGEGKSSRMSSSEFHQKASKLWVRHCNASVPVFMLVRTCLCIEWWHHQQRSFWNRTLAQKIHCFSHRRVSILSGPLTACTTLGLRHHGWPWVTDNTVPGGLPSKSPVTWFTFGLQPSLPVYMYIRVLDLQEYSNFKSCVLLPDHKSGHVSWGF